MERATAPESPGGKSEPLIERIHNDGVSHVGRRYKHIERASLCEGPRRKSVLRGRHHAAPWR